MADTVSDRFALPFLSSGQAQKEISHNEALALIDMLLHAHAESAALSTPPGSAVEGQCWIVAAGATGEWTEHEGALACLTSGGWRFIAPRAGMRVSVGGEEAMLVHDGLAWRSGAIRPDGVYVRGVKVLGERNNAIVGPAGGGVVDGQARTAIAQILTALRNHGLIEAE